MVWTEDLPEHLFSFAVGKKARAWGSNRSICSRSYGGILGMIRTHIPALWENAWMTQPRGQIWQAMHDAAG